MPTITIYKPADLTINIVEGDPPVNQSAELTALRSENDALRAKIAAARAAAQAAKDRDEANVEGQAVLDALA